jgi:serpin B
MELDTSGYSLKQQIMHGWGIESFFCHNDQVLILKATNESPTCVNSETKEKLLEREWAILTPKERLYDIEKILNDKDCSKFGFWLDEFVDGNFNENDLIIDLPVSDELSERIYDSIPYCIYNTDDESFKLNTKHFIDFEELEKPVYRTSIVDANNKFALDFYSHAKENDKNVFFSPLSIMTAFAIVYEGANDTTADEMQKVFGFPIEEQKRKKEFQSILKGFEDNNLIPTSEYMLYMANALWIADHFEPKKEYINTAQTYYDSTVEKVDFVSDQGANTINDWVKKQTQNKINEIIKPEDTNELTALVITNTIYFKGDWVVPFKSYKTQQKDFHINENENVKVEMMHMGKPLLNYVETDLLQMIQLPYKGDKVSMLVLLPKDMDGLDTLEKELTVENLTLWRNGLEEKMTGIYLPKFTTNTEYDLKEKLSQMGIHIAFDSNDADFSGISDRHIFIGKAIHKAFVNVDEKGTEAAAATAAMAEFSSGPSHMFRADHPFVYIIQDDTNGNILFIGKVVNPLQ